MDAESLGTAEVAGGTLGDAAGTPTARPTYLRRPSSTLEDRARACRSR